MAYTLSQLVTDVRGKLDDTNFSSTLIKDFINDTQRYIVNKHHFKFMEDTYTQVLTIDDYEYALGADVEVIESLRITSPSGKEVDITDGYLTYIEFDQKHPLPSEDDSNTPDSWTIREDQLFLYPKPDAAYTLTIRYQKKPTTLSSDSDVPEVPERFKELLVLGALVRAHKYNDNYDIAQAEQATLDELLLDAVSKTYTRQNRPTIMRVNGRRG
jgi:hypothetical protein